MSAEHWQAVAAVIAMILAVAGIIVAVRHQSFEVPNGFCGLLYRDGKSLHRITPGRHCFWKGRYAVRLVDMRRTVLRVDCAEALTADDCAVKINVLIIFQIIQAETAMHDVVDYVAFLRRAVQSSVCAAVRGLPQGRIADSRIEIGQCVLESARAAGDRIGIVVHAAEVTGLSVREPV
jgi:hypothetical protein